MPLSTASSSTSAVSPSSLQYVNALLSGGKWGGPTGTGVTVEYSFPWTSAANATFSGFNDRGAYSYLDEPYAASHYGLSGIEQAAARSAVQAWAHVAGIGLRAGAPGPEQRGAHQRHFVALGQQHFDAIAESEARQRRPERRHSVWERHALAARR